MLAEAYTAFGKTQFIKTDSKLKVTRIQIKQAPSTYAIYRRNLLIQTH